MWLWEMVMPYVVVWAVGAVSYITFASMSMSLTGGWPEEQEAFGVELDGMLIEGAAWPLRTLWLAVLAVSLVPVGLGWLLAMLVLLVRGE